MKCKYCEEEFEEQDFGNNCIGCGYILLPEEYEGESDEMSDL